MIRQTKHSGRSVLEMSNDHVRVYVAPELGGRILQIEIENSTLLFENENLKGMANVQGTSRWNGNWQNFGGEKLWVAPQGWTSDDEWPGPPDPVIDGGSYKVSADNDVIELTSSVEPHIGVQVGRSIHLHEKSSRLEIDAWLRNHSERSKDLAIWPVVQVEASSYESGHYKVFFGRDRSRNGFSIIHGIVNSPQWRLRDNIVEVDYQYIAGKIGSDTDCGWACYMNCDKGVCLVANFEREEDLTYFHDAPLQVWTQGRGSIYTRGSLSVCPDNMKINPGYMQIELQSPLRRVRSGEIVRYHYSLWACRVHANASIISAGRNWVATSNIVVGRENVVAHLGVAIEGYVSVESGGNVVKIPVSPSSPADIDVHISSGDVSVMLLDSDSKIVERIYRSHRSFASILCDPLYQ